MMTGFGVGLALLVEFWWRSAGIGRRYSPVRAPIALAALLLLRGLPAHPPRTEHAQIDIVSTLALVLAS